jgi:hypothetical protein
MIPQAEHEYHAVELDYKNPNNPDALDWCLERFGPPESTSWFWKPNKIYFYDPQDHLMFLLRWAA